MNSAGKDQRMKRKQIRKTALLDSKVHAESWSALLSFHGSVPILNKRKVESGLH